jgi:ubiquinone/menaquinone biosynthesis C-methylase UbiE
MTAAEPDFLAPFGADLLRLCARGLALRENPEVLDLCSGNGTASILLAREFGARCTGVDLSEGLLRSARETALAGGLEGRVEFLKRDARHLDFPIQSFDLVLALGGALTYAGRPETLERIGQLLRPGGSLLMSDLVYLNGSAPEPVRRRLAASNPPLPPAELPLEPSVRAVYEEGVWRFESEESYMALLETMGFSVSFSFLAPESAWNRYYAAAAEAGEAAPERHPVGTEELAAFYAWGGRWGMGYLICGATRSPGE